MKKTAGLLDKKRVLRSIKDLPERCSADDVLERIHLLQAIEQGIAGSEEGKGITLADAKRRHRKWLK